MHIVKTGFIISQCVVNWLVKGFHDDDDDDTWYWHTMLRQNDKIRFVSLDHPPDLQ
jgi:hypothetical protein